MTASIASSRLPLYAATKVPARHSAVSQAVAHRSEIRHPRQAGEMRRGQPLQAFDHGVEQNA
jgi:hypothetical protein